MKYIIFLLLTLITVTAFAEPEYIKPYDPQNRGPIPFAPMSRTSGKEQTTRTTGFIDGKYVDLTTKVKADGTTITTGHIDGEYVRLKEKKKH